MTRLAMIATLILAAGPALANYGDVDMQIADLKSETVSFAATLTDPAHQRVAGDTCQLTFDHLVSIPAEFIAQPGVEMACLTPQTGS